MATENKIRSLVRRIRELVDELDAEVQEKETIGQTAKRLLDFFVKHWELTHPGEKYVVSGAKDMASFKRVLKTLHPRDVAGRILTYVKSSDPFIVNARHSMGVFFSKINELSPGNHVPRGCKHNPPCVDGAAHTRRQIEEDRVDLR